MKLIKSLIQRLYEQTKNKEIEWKYITDLSELKEKGIKINIIGEYLYYIYLNNDTIVGINKNIEYSTINVYLADMNKSISYKSKDIFTELDELIYGLYYLIDNEKEPFEDVILNYLFNTAKD